ncbi:MAG: tRNA pseudouridine(55) synthase TruB [Pseudomonadota bacterium]
MARRKKGRALDGWVIIDKPAGISSNAVVNKLRWVLDAQKAGHAGTLDPEATGLLAVAFGEATKTVPWVTDDLKAYDFRVRLGQATKTDDAEGEVIARSDTRPSDAEIKAALSGFVGDIEQVPPEFSAVKIDGERAYAQARRGEDVTLAARPLYVDQLSLITRVDPDHVDLHLVCGKGGYVRSIARDLGRALGCYGHVATLRRVWSGPFSLDNHGMDFSIFDLTEKTPALDTHLLPVEAALGDYLQVALSESQARAVIHGNATQLSATDLDHGQEAWASFKGLAIALGQYEGGAFHPARVLNRGLL